MFSKNPVCRMIESPQITQNPILFNHPATPAESRLKVIDFNIARFCILVSCTTFPRSKSNSQRVNCTRAVVTMLQLRHKKNQNKLEM